VNTIVEIQNRLKDKNVSEVARRAGMAYPTVYNIYNGKATDIRMSTYHRLIDVLDQMDAAKEV
jgi:predicted transcriptional regulator